MKAVSKPVQTSTKWVCRIFGVLVFLQLALAVVGIIAVIGFGFAPHWMGKTTRAALSRNLFPIGFGEFLMAALGVWLVQKGWQQDQEPEENALVGAPTSASSTRGRSKRWSACNILHAAPDANRLWQFGVKGGNFVLAREQRAVGDEPLPPRLVAKSWSSLWQPRLNIAWLPPESVFLRVIELPKSSFGETLAMVELQLEKLSPLPAAQTVWSLHVVPAANGDLQTVVVIIAGRAVVEEFLGKLEKSGYLADRLEAPMLDLLETAPAAENGAWIYVGARGKDAALVAWRSQGALRHLCLIALPPEGDRAKSLKDQLAQLCWAGEMEGWLTEPPQWHLVADPVNAAEWEKLLRDALNEPVRVAPPPPPAELAARTARRAAASPPGAALLPTEFAARYREQFVDRLWLRGLITTGILYAVGVAIYFGAVQVLQFKTEGVERQVAALADSYTNVLQLKARYAVLSERQELKYAALDCLKVVAESLPTGLTLQRYNFNNGQELALSGVCAPDQIDEILGQGQFYDAVRKAKVDGQDLFDPAPVSGLAYNESGNTMTWHFTLRLKYAETNAEDTP
jgi:hypothetical protein